MLLHGSYGSGAAIVSWWTSLAEQEGIVLVAPDAREREAWHLRADGPQFIRAVIDRVGGEASDRQRAHLSVRQLRWRGVLAHAVDVGVATVRSDRSPCRRVARADEFRAVPYAKRKIPIAIFIGDKDEYFPLFAVRKTQSALEQAGHPVSVTVIPGHSHPYAHVALEVNRSAWEFMKANRL